jgi:2-iminoacetate synthase
MIEHYLQPWLDLDYPLSFQGITQSEVQASLAKTILQPRDLLNLLSPAALPYLERMAQKARQLTLQYFGRTVQLYTPLYLSNYCENGCLYCGFNGKHNIQRSKLSFEELRLEAQKIAAKGIGHLLLLTGGDRRESGLDYILPAVRLLGEYFPSLSMEMYAMEEEEYRLLIQAGIHNLTLYQETYNQSLYSRLHPFGEKSDFDYRLQAPDRAAKAGMPQINLGVLMGLDDPMEDFFKAALHGEYLRKTYSQTEISFSVPRIQPAVGAFKAIHPVSHTQLVQCIIALRLFMPRAGISLSTRESRELRNHLLPLGVTKMSADSRTSVGSRSRQEQTEDQFTVADKRSVEELDRDLRKMGYQPVYKDWESLCAR